MRKTLLAVALSITALSAHADYQCSVTPRDDVILSPQQVQVKGENGDLVIKPDGNLTFNGKAYALSAAQREQAQDYQASLRSSPLIFKPLLMSILMHPKVAPSLCPFKAVLIRSIRSHSKATKKLVWTC